MLLPELASQFFSRAATAVARISVDPGAAIVIDGETLVVDATVVRLFGIAAPARGVACMRPGARPIDCGALAADNLARLVRNRSVRCDLLDRDGRRTAPARCSASGVDLARAMVADGWASASEAEADTITAEQAARSARIGMWAAD